MIQRTLLWTPRVKGRPRTRFVGGSYRTFTPRETAEAELALRQQWVGTPTEGPIAVLLDLSDTEVYIVIQPCPPPTSRKLRGDVDNYTKLVMDALNGRAWLDDRQIVALSVRKM